MGSIKELITNKQRIVFTGCRSSRKFASIVAHVLQYHHKKFDLLDSGDLINHSGSAPLALIICSEKPNAQGIAEFRTYDHHIGVITEIEFQSDNGYSDEDEYIRQYDLFADTTPKAGLLAYCESDEVASVLCNKERADVAYIPYKAHSHTELNGEKYLVTSHKDKVKAEVKDQDDLKWFGGAKELLKKIGITSDQFYQAIPSYHSA